MRPRGSRGSAVIELTLLAPWVLFPFVGGVDMGFYSYDMIAVENASRVAAEYTSQSATVQADQTGACTRMLAELTMVLHQGASPCSASPVVVTARAVTGPDGNPAESLPAYLPSSRTSALS